MNPTLGKLLVAATLATTSPLALAATAVTINAIDETGVGKPLGVIAIEETPDGIVLEIELEGIPPGEHGFHVHENASCGPKESEGKPVAGMAAGGHYDPKKTGKHEGPKGEGHLGDLPVVTANMDAKITTKVVAPRLKAADLQGRSLMIHQGGDNYSDKPKPLGGGGGRIACGVVK